MNLPYPCFLFIVQLLWGYNNDEELLLSIVIPTSQYPVLHRHKFLDSREFNVSISTRSVKGLCSVKAEKHSFIELISII